MQPLGVRSFHRHKAPCVPKNMQGCSTISAIVGRPSAGAVGGPATPQSSVDGCKAGVEMPGKVCYPPPHTHTHQPALSFRRTRLWAWSSTGTGAEPCLPAGPAQGDLHRVCGEHRRCTAAQSRHLCLSLHLCETETGHLQCHCEAPISEFVQMSSFVLTRHATMASSVISPTTVSAFSITFTISTISATFSTLFPLCFLSPPPPPIPLSSSSILLHHSRAVRGAPW